MAAPSKPFKPFTPAQLQSSAKTTEDKESLMPFGKTNYIIFIIGLLTVIIGFYLMAGEKFIDAKEFSKALYVAPFVIIGGFVVIAWGIMVNPAKNNKSGDSDRGI
jgi:uncharacterized membrane protein